MWRGAENGAIAHELEGWIPWLLISGFWVRVPVGSPQKPQQNAENDDLSALGRSSFCIGAVNGAAKLPPGLVARPDRGRRRDWGHGEKGIQTNSQLITNRLGKILRINPDGSIPADNPTSFPGIPGTTTGLNRAIYARQ